MHLKRQNQERAKTTARVNLLVYSLRSYKLADLQSNLNKSYLIKILSLKGKLLKPALGVLAEEPYCEVQGQGHSINLPSGDGLGNWVGLN